MADDKQLDWLDEARKLRRNADPPASHASAQRVVALGIVQKQRDSVLALIRMHPGRDVSGLVKAAEHHGLRSLDRAAISKRLSDLHKQGLIVTPNPDSTQARIWFAK